MGHTQINKSETVSWNGSAIHSIQCKCFVLLIITNLNDLATKPDSDPGYYTQQFNVYNLTYNLKHYLDRISFVNNI